jgi:DNA-binding NtrC family response regulator
MLERAAFSGTGETIDVEDIFIGKGNTFLGSTITANNAVCPLDSIASGPEINGGLENPGRCGLAGDEGRWSTMAEVEREHIRRTLDLSNGNRSEAAQLLGMERHQLARKLRKYGLEVSSSKRVRTSKRTA